MADPQASTTAAAAPAPAAAPANAAAPSAISDDTLKAFTSAAPDRQRAALGNMSLEAKQALLAKIKASQAGGSEGRPAATAAAGAAATTTATPAAAKPATPTEPTSPPPDPPSWRDRVISYLITPNPRYTPTDPGDPKQAYKAPLGDLDPVDTARRALGSIAPLVLHPYDSAKAAFFQGADALLAAQGWMLGHSDLERFRGKGKVTDALVDAIEQGRANTKATLAAMLDQARRDPHGFLAEQAGQLAAAHGVGEAAGMARTAAGEALGHAKTATTKALLGISPTEVKEGIVDPKVAENADELQESYQKTVQQAASHQQQLADVQAENATKEARVAAANAKRLTSHMEAIDQVRADNDAALKEASDKTAALQDKATAAHEQATQDAADAELADKRRGQLARDEISTRQAIMDRVKQVAAATKSRVAGMFDDVRDRVNNIAEKEKVTREDHGPDASYWKLDDAARAAIDQKVPTPATSLAPLVESIAKAEDFFKGSQEKVSVFRDIVSRAKTDGATDDLREQIAQGTFRGRYDDLDPAKKQAVDKAAADYQSHYFTARGEEPPAEQQIDFDHLRGYSSELGKAIDQNIRGGGDGDIRQALFAVKSQVDAMAQHLADSAKAGGKLRTAKQWWHIYKSVFDEPSGHAGGGRATGSPVAQAVEAGKAFPAGDAFHATEPFLVKDAEGASRARQLLVGRKFTDPYFDPNAGRLLDRLRAIKREQAGLPKPEKTAAAIAGKPATAEPPVVATVEPKLKPEPKPKEPLTFNAKKEPVAPPPVEPDLNDITPVELQHLKQAKLLDRFKEFRKLTTYRVSRMIAGSLSLVGGLAALGGSVLSLAQGAKLGLELGGAAGISAGVGAFAWALGPRIFANLLDSSKTIRLLTAPTAEELEYVRSKLPLAQRAGIEQAIKELSAEAQRQGKIRQPSPWLAIFRDMAESGAASANKQGRAKQAGEAAAEAARQAKEQQDWLANPANDPDRPEFYQEQPPQQEADQP